MTTALPVSIPLDLPCVSTMRAAMEAAAHAAIALSDQYEVGGAIYSADGKYCYTKPVTQGAATEIDYKVALPRGATLAALWHTHVGHTHDVENFSTDDLSLADRLHLPMYVFVVSTYRVIGYNGARGFAIAMPPPAPHCQQIEILNVTYCLQGRTGDTLHLERNGETFIYRSPSSTGAIQ